MERSVRCWLRRQHARIAGGAGGRRLRSRKTGWLRRDKRCACIGWRGTRLRGMKLWSLRRQAIGMAAMGRREGAGPRVALELRVALKLCRVMRGPSAIGIRHHRPCERRTPAALRVIVVGPLAPVHASDPLTSVSGGPQARNPKDAVAPGHEGCQRQPFSVMVKNALRFRS